MSEGTCLVGLDVHQAQSVAAVLDPVTGELRVVRLRGAPGDVVPVFLEGFGRPVRAVYEAGSTGFGLARAATRRRLDVRVIAPGSIPRAPGDRVKTDRRDAKRLVRLFAAGELSFSFVLSEEEEHFRDLVRCIDDARKDLMRFRLLTPAQTEVSRRHLEASRALLCGSVECSDHFVKTAGIGNSERRPPESLQVGTDTASH